MVSARRERAALRCRYAGAALMAVLMAVLTALSIGVAACGPKRIDLPTDPGSPLPDYASIHNEVASGCSRVRSLRAEVSLSGSANGGRLSGTLHAGFRKPESMRLELRARLLGTPIFALGANESGATLLLPRDNQFVRGPKAGDILGALTGISLSPADLLAILTGCVVPEPRATGGRSHANGWASIELDGRATLYLQRAGGRWRVRVAQRGDWRIEYLEWAGTATFPSKIQLSAVTPVAVALSTNLAKMEPNVDFDDSDFVVPVPPGAEALSLDDIRRAGPLKEQP
jgi:hypothetical protein